MMNQYFISLEDKIWCQVFGIPMGFFFFITLVQFISIFYDANKSKYWLNWGELTWAYLNMFSNIFDDI